MSELLIEFVNPMSTVSCSEQEIKREPIDTQEKDLIDQNNKCGEIFALIDGNFILICGFCHDKHENIITFRIHIKEQHCDKLNDIIDYLSSKQIPADPISANEQQTSYDGIVCPSQDIFNPTIDSFHSKEKEADVNKLDLRKKSIIYSCEICGQTYKQKGRLRNHQLKNNCKKAPPEKVDSFEEGDSSELRPTTKAEEERVQGEQENIKQTNETPQPDATEIEIIKNKESTIPEVMPDNLKIDPDAVKKEYVDGHEESVEEDFFFDDAGNFYGDTTNDAPKKKKNVKIPKQFPCTECKKCFRSKQALSYHTKRYHNLDANSDKETPQKEQSLRCKYCNQEFPNKEECIGHEGTHIGEKRFICFYCPHTFRTNYGRKRHMRVHTGERPYKCTECPKAFPHMVQLDYHLRKHKELKEFSCETCGKSFYRKFELNLHERRHTGFRPLICEDCGKTFNLMSELNEHRKRHTDKKDWKCAECGKSFYTKWTLKDHMAGHSDATPFACEVCGKKFSRSKALKKHKKLHSDVKSYVCNICGKAYAQDSGLYAHKKTHGIRKSQNTPIVSSNKAV